MTPVKRLEIVIEAAHVVALLSTLRANGATAYTLINDVQGLGDRGDRTGDPLTNVYRNSYILIACEKPLADTLAQCVKPLLTQHGGMCLVSDAQWLEH